MPEIGRLGVHDHADTPGGGTVTHSDTTGQVATDHHTAAILESLLTTRGDIIHRAASDLERIALGAADTVLTSDGTDAAWVAAGGGADISARVYKSGSQSIADSTATALTFDVERWDTDTIHDTGSNTSRLTAITAGKYVISGHVRWGGDSMGLRQLNIVHNTGGVIAGNWENNPTTSAFDMSVAVIYDMAENEYVELQVWQNSGAALSVLIFARSSIEFGMSKVLG